MNTTLPSGNEQARLWNGSGGQTWVEAQTLLDRMFKPLEDLLAATIDAGAASDILDVGCGTGSTTLAAARRLAEPGRAIGIDISGPMIAAARARAERDGIPAVFVLKTLIPLFAGMMALQGISLAIRAANVLAREPSA